MRKIISLLAVTVIVGLMGATSVFALDFGINSTIQDFVVGSAFPGGVSSPGNEDNETEPGTTQGQAWDLEGGFFNESVITMVGGYDFLNGQLYNGTQYYSGDIFIDLDGDSVQNSSGDQGNYNFEYALRFLDITSPNGPSLQTITLFDLTGVSTEQDFLYTKDIKWSSPWRVGDNVSGTDTGVGVEFWKLSDTEVAEVGFAGYNGVDTHYALQLDLNEVFSSLGGWSAVRGENNPIFQFTMYCGNDQLRFQDPVPEPSTVLLLGIGLVGLFTFGRKQFKK